MRALVPIALIVFVGLWAQMAAAPPAFGAGGEGGSGEDPPPLLCVVISGSCTAPEPTACDQVTTGTNNCGDPCTKRGAACCEVISGSCTAPEPTACDQVTTGTNNCGNACSKKGPSCFSWQPYGFSAPSEPAYRFGYPDPHSRDFLGLAAKGNVVIGDYTKAGFQETVLPLLRPGPESVTQPYVIDPSDADLGYFDFGTDAKGRMRFSGNYDQFDGGTKLDGTARKFYESGLPDADFSALVDPKLSEVTWEWTGTKWKEETERVILDGVLFTNHALAGLVKAKYLDINGTMIARDDALRFRQRLIINHDVRLVGSRSDDMVLPFTIKRPRRIDWKECPPEGCS